MEHPTLALARGVTFGPITLLFLWLLLTGVTAPNVATVLMVTVFLLSAYGLFYLLWWVFTQR